MPNESTSYNILKKEFNRYSIDTSQDIIQQYLQLEFNEYGMRKVLDLLFEWELKTGYVIHEKLTRNEHFEYFDVETGVTFRSQINYARTDYLPYHLVAKMDSDIHCPICFDNIGAPGRENLRAFRFKLEGRQFFIQLSPFSVFKKHYVLIEEDKIPMKMDGGSVRDLLTFVGMLPGSIGCSNSDVEWAGSSILNHHHYQVIESVSLPVMKAGYIDNLHEIILMQGSDLEFGLLNYPTACCKILSSEESVLIMAAGAIIAGWKAKDPGKNTCNILVLYEDEGPVCYIFFRNPNYRTPLDLLKVKKEGIGILEVAGEGIYPVPEGINSVEVWDIIRNRGLEVIKRIIAGNNPVNRERFPELFLFLKDAINKK